LRHDQLVGPAREHYTQNFGCAVAIDAYTEMIRGVARAEAVKA
jgi:hypothetical protein